MTRQKLSRFGKTAGRVILALLVTAFLLLPAIYTNSVFGYLPILFTLFLLLASGLYLYFMRKAISITADHGLTHATRGETVKVDLNIRNNSFLVCTKAKADIYVEDYLGSVNSFAETIFSIDSKSNADFGFDVAMDHIGVYKAGIRNMHIFGLLGVLSLNIPFESEFEVVVLPNVHEEEGDLSAESLTESADASSFVENDGSDYTGVRDYAFGDPMKRIHWKLSAHSNGYMTKITETGRKSDMAVILDMKAVKQSTEELLTLADGIVETGVSLIKSAQNQDIEHVLLYPDRDCQIVAAQPRNDSDYAELVRRLHPISFQTRDGFPDAVNIVRQEGQAANKAANVLVVTSNPDSTLLDTLVEIKNQQRNPMLYVILPPGSNADDRKKAAAGFGSLEDSGIYFELRAGRERIEF